MIQKIAFIGGRDVHSIGGIENYIYNLSHNLTKNNIKVIVYSESDHNSTIIEDGIKIVSWKTFHWNKIDKPLFGLISTLHSLFVEKDVNLIHYNTFAPSFFSWLPRLFRKKTVIQGHGLEWKRTKYTRTQQRIIKSLEELMAHMNSNFIMVSQEQTDYFKKEYGKICTTITPGISYPENYSDDEEKEFLNKFHLEPQKYFLFLGRLVQEKKPDELINAFLKTKHKDIKLVIAGDNPQNPKYVQSLKTISENNPNIVFTGVIYGKEKNIAIKNSLAFCLPSVLEGLPISLLEAMSYSRCCLVSDIPGCREACGENGIYISIDNLANGFADAMNKVIDNIIQWSEIGKTNKERAYNFFTWDKITEKYLSYINTL